MLERLVDPGWAVDPTTAAFVGLSVLLLTGVLAWEDLLKEKSAWDTLVWFGALVTGIRLAGAYSITALVAAEMIGSHAGLGFLTLNSQEIFQIPSMYAGIVLLALLGLALNYVLALLEKRLTRWRSGLEFHE